MKTYKLITLNPLKLVTNSVSGKPASIQVKDGYPAPTPPWWPEFYDAKYAYIEELPIPEEAPAEGFIWTRELTAEAYGWKQVEAPPAPNPEWYEQPTWRVRAIADVTPYGDGMLIDAITALVDSIEDPVQKAISKEVFFGGNTLDRNSDLLVAMAGALGLDDTQLDDMFIQANDIQV